MTDLGGDRLSDADALMWRIETDPVLRSPILAVGLLDGDLGADDVRDAFEHASQGIVRLRQRIQRDGPLPGQLRWVDDPRFDVHHHVHERIIPDGDLRAVLDLAAEDAAAAFDPARPPWTATIARGLEDGRSALVLRFHHSITDGVGGVDLAEALFERIGKASKAGPIAGPTAAPIAGRPGPFRRLAQASGRTVSMASDPIGTARGSLRTVRSVGRLLAPAGDQLSPLLTGRSIDRRLDVLEVPLDSLRELSHRWDTTINDVFLGAVGGALHAYHRHFGADVAALRFTMPVNRRTADDAPGGNRFTPVRFVLPVDDPEPENRARLAGALSRSWRSEPSIGFTDILATVLNQLPDGAVTAVFAGMLRAVDVDAVDVPGLREPVALAGARLERLWAFAPPTGAALSITLLSHVDTGCIAILSDTAAVAEPERLADCVADAFDDLVRRAEEPVATTARS